MSDHVYKHITLTGTSETSSDDAIRVAITKAATTMHGMHWFEVLETRGMIESNAIKRWQVTLKIGFTLDD